MADIKANELEEKASNAVNGDKVIVIDSEDNSKVKLLDITKFKGDSGDDGEDGTAGNDGQNGLSSYELWLADGNTGNIQVFLESLNGADGEDGENGSDGADGDSAYQSWLNLGNTGTEADFMIAVIGTDGEDGEDGLSPVPRGIWSNLNVYEKLAIVSYAGGGYISRTHQNQGDINDPIYWLQISEKGEDAEGGDMFNTNNLSGLTDFDVARTNMSVYSKAESDAKYSLLTHNHDSLYSAINHDHSGIYEPVFTKFTAFNKNFGTGAGDVAEGNHTHASIYFTQTEISNLIATAKQEAKTETKNEILDGAGASYDTLLEIQAELQSNDTDIATILSNQSNKMDKVPSETGRFGRFLANGNLEATDVLISDIIGLQTGLDGKANLLGGNTFDGDQVLNDSLKFGTSSINNGGNDRLKLYAKRDVGTSTASAFELYTNNGGADVGRYYITGADHLFRNVAGDDLMRLQNNGEVKLLGAGKNLRFGSDFYMTPAGNSDGEDGHIFGTYSTNGHKPFLFRINSSNRVKIGEDIMDVKTPMKQGDIITHTQTVYINTATALEVKRYDGTPLTENTRKCFRIRASINGTGGAQIMGDWQVLINASGTIIINAIYDWGDGNTVEIFNDGGIVKARLNGSSQKYEVILHIQEKVTGNNEFWRQIPRRWAPTLENSWENYATDWEPASYRKTKEGIVHIDGMVKNGTSGTIFTLPEGYRPNRKVMMLTIKSGEVPIRIDVYPSGTVNLTGFTTSSWNSIHCSFSLYN